MVNPLTVRVSRNRPGSTVTTSGSGVTGVTGADGAEDGLVPMAFVAVTPNV